MKYILPSALICSLAAAHSAVNTIVFDGTLYPARAGPVDTAVNAKRIEWTTTAQVLYGYQPLTNVSDPAIKCQVGAGPPQLTAVARAGSNITVQWSPIVRGHLGPAMSVKFFKISDKGYDKQTKLWGSEVVMLNNNTETMQIPSNIKSGLYIFRTELLALHGNANELKSSSLGGPQFYPHCFNVKILGNGTDEPKGVTIPGAFKRDESTTLDVWYEQDAHSRYISPGPPVYIGKYASPIREAPVVSNVGFYPPGLQRRYDDLRNRVNIASKAIVDLVNSRDFGNSRTEAPGTIETLQLAAGLGGEFFRVPKLLYDINAFNKMASEVMN